jgi:hypothetical protein
MSIIHKGIEKDINKNLNTKHKYSKEVPRMVTAMRKQRWEAGDK